MDGFNWRKAPVYIKINKHLITKNAENKRETVETMRYLPIRKSNRGTEPGMGSTGLKTAKGSEKKQWFFPNNNPSKQIIKQMMGMVAEIAIRILWENYSYTFGGKLYLQAGGGPIGQRPTMVASRIVMQDFMEDYRTKLTEAGLRTTLLKVYVDDARQVTTKLKK